MQIGLEMRLKLIDHGGGFILPQQAVVHQDAGELVANRPRQECGYHRRVNAPGEAADDPVAADPPPQIGDDALGEVLKPPGAGAAAGRREEVLQDRAAGRRVGDLRVELKAVDRQRVVPDGGQRTGARAGQRPKIGGYLIDLIAVAHPHLGVGGHAGKEPVCLEHLTGGAAIFA